jgi:hypothetical protein
MVNVLWGAFNLLIAYLLICKVGTFDLRRTRDAAVMGVGAVVMGLTLSRAFGALYGGL